MEAGPGPSRQGQRPPIVAKRNGYRIRRLPGLHSRARAGFRRSRYGRQERRPRRRRRAPPAARPRFHRPGREGRLLPCRSRLSSGCRLGHGVATETVPFDHHDLVDGLSQFRHLYGGTNLDLLLDWFWRVDSGRVDVPEHIGHRRVLTARRRLLRLDDAEGARSSISPASSGSAPPPLSDGCGRSRSGPASSIAPAPPPAGRSPDRPRMACVAVGLHLEQGGPLSGPSPRQSLPPPPRTLRPHPVRPTT